MPGADRWGAALLAATALHAGFQLTVSTVVYPALADLARPTPPAGTDPAGPDPASPDPVSPVPTRAEETRSWSTWERAHAAHSRRIGPLVGVVYPVLALALAGRLRAGRDLPTVLAASCSAAAVGLTATVAAPLHGRLGPRPEPALVHRLLVADRGRSAFAVAALLAALVGVSSPAHQVARSSSGAPGLPVPPAAPPR